MLQVPWDARPRQNVVLVVAGELAAGIGLARLVALVLRPVLCVKG